MCFLLLRMVKKWNCAKTFLGSKEAFKKEIGRKKRNQGIVNPPCAKEIGTENNRMKGLTS